MALPNPLTFLFKEQLEKETIDLAQKYGLGQRGHCLIYWYFMRLFGLTEAEVKTILCDDPQDLGIDVIWIDQDIAHFYQFKHPEDFSKAIPAGDVDKTISGFQVILHRQHQTIANPKLIKRIEAVYQQVPKAYQLHFISSGEGVTPESRVKLNSFKSELNGPNSSVFEWDDQPLSSIQQQFYRDSLPAISQPINLPYAQHPYMVRTGSAGSFWFHLSGQFLAELYEDHREGLLQRNIRTDQGDTPTNKAIEGTCVGRDSDNFLHYNNGVTFLCEKADLRHFNNLLVVEKAQVINGGQTIRALHRAFQKGTLKGDVIVMTRVIAASGDQDFANNVAVNQNHQNQVGTGFLRSGDLRIVQLAKTMESHGWYLERRDGELKTASTDDLHLIELSIRRPLDGRVIRLKDGAQAYTATFYGQPEVAKKNPKLIFDSIEDGGYFERIFSHEMTAEKFIISHQIKAYVDDFVKQFMGLRRKVQAQDLDPIIVYKPLLGDTLMSAYVNELHQVIAQCALFLCGTLYHDLAAIRKSDPATIPGILQKEGSALIREHLRFMIDFHRDPTNPMADRSWPVLLKSNSFFGHIKAYISGIRRGPGLETSNTP
jgi:hypothetical protein